MANLQWVWASAVGSSRVIEFGGKNTQNDGGRRCPDPDIEDNLGCTRNPWSAYLFDAVVGDSFCLSCLLIGQLKREVVNSADVAFAFGFVAQHDFDLGFRSSAALLNRHLYFFGLLGISCHCRRVGLSLKRCKAVRVQYKRRNQTNADRFHRISSPENWKISSHSDGRHLPGLMLQVRLSPLSKAKRNPKGKAVVVLPAIERRKLAL